MTNIVLNNIRTIFYMYRSKIFIFILLPILNAFLNIYTGFFSFYIMLGFAVVLATPEIESRDKAYISILSAPCKRSEYVIGRYISLLIWGLVVVSSGLGINFILNIISPDKISMPSLSIIKITTTYMILSICIYYLIYFAFSLKATRVSYFIIFIVLIIGSAMEDFIGTGNFLLYRIKGISSLIMGAGVLINIIYIVILVAVVMLVANISAVLYNRKDL